MLTRNSQIGEFYVMMPPQTEPMGDAADTGKCKNTCDLLIFCEESDKHVRISWEDAMKATMISTNGANDTIPSSGGDDVNMAGGMKLSDWLTAAGDVNDFNQGKTKWADFAKKANVLNCRIVLARPFIEHMMHSAVLAVSGRATGATLFGPSDSAPRALFSPLLHLRIAHDCARCCAVQLSANTQVKT